MNDLPEWIPVAGEIASAARLRLYAERPGTQVRSGEGWLAVAAGTPSNDQNGVISEPGAISTPALVHELVQWFAHAALPASWLLAGDDSWLTAELIRSGARPENAGWWAGGEIGADVLHRTAPGIVVTPVTSLCNLAVVPSERRRGIGTALASARLTAAHDRGARRAVSALSPDGWQLYRTLGFVSTRVTLNRCFYLPID